MFMYFYLHVRNISDEMSKEDFTGCLKYIQLNSSLERKRRSQEHSKRVNKNERARQNSDVQAGFHLLVVKLVYEDRSVLC